MDTADQQSTSSADKMAQARRVLSLIDLTSLGDDDRPETVEALCRSAVTAHGSVAAVCVWPRFIAQAVSHLAGSGIGVAGVANFPQGEPAPELAVADAQAIVQAGGTEVDVVFPWRALAGGRSGVGRDLVATTRATIGTDVVLKVILETGELQDPDLITAAASEALDGGADFLKTSTGKTNRSATPAAAQLLLEVIRAAETTAGLKVSGGVRTMYQAAGYLALADDVMGPDWARPATFRIGASSLLADVLSVLDDNSPAH